jgi:hypothetical protein
MSCWLRRKKNWKSFYFSSVPWASRHKKTLKSVGQLWRGQHRYRRCQSGRLLYSWQPRKKLYFLKLEDFFGISRGASGFVGGGELPTDIWTTLFVVCPIDTTALTRHQRRYRRLRRIEQVRSSTLICILFTRKVQMLSKNNDQVNLWTFFTPFKRHRDTI